MDNLNHIAENLFLTITNDGAGTICGTSYYKRCDLAAATARKEKKIPIEGITKASVSEIRHARDWLQMTVLAEDWLARNHPETDRATARDLLAAALAVAEYYSQHVAEAAKSMEKQHG